MNLTLKMEQFNPIYLFFRDTKKNILMDGNFTKLIYSHELFTMNGIYLSIPIYIHTINVVSNKLIVNYSCLMSDEIQSIEQQILENYQQMFRCSYKIMVFKMTSQIKKECLFLPLTTSDRFDQKMQTLDWKEWQEGHKKLCVKIGGIWESQNEIGLTYHFVY